MGHHDRTGTVLCISKKVVMRGRSWTRQTMNDAWDATNRDGLCGTPWHMVPPELKFTKKVIAVKEGAGLLLPNDVVGRKIQRLSQECVVGRQRVCSAGIAWPRDKTAQQRMSRKSQTDY